ncbi:protein of unknown function [Candidatus Methylomirabilis oxygeniifera]|uniref:Uncharacterized protein n=1 Tax=Methylomirabilis oxygeniifera TaxID=671143 RepID=D5MJ33_METO1|nr:protein of unknown function [Candidatus Methylomirabilis oxyfera]
MGETYAPVLHTPARAVRPYSQRLQRTRRERTDIPAFDTHIVHPEPVKA